MVGNSRGQFLFGVKMKIGPFSFQYYTHQHTNKKQQQADKQGSKSKQVRVRRVLG
jgi:hypothetical protein